MSACVEAQGRLHDKGYVMRSEGDRDVFLHREAWEQAHGPIPEGLIVHHRCENKVCVNPDHLQVVTRAQHLLLHPGTADVVYAERRSRTHCAHDHEYTPENTYWRSDGGRACRACKRAEWHRRKDRA